MPIRVDYAPAQAQLRLAELAGLGQRAREAQAADAQFINQVAQLQDLQNRKRATELQAAVEMQNIGARRASDQDQLASRLVRDRAEQQFRAQQAELDRVGGMARDRQRFEQAQTVAGQEREALQQKRQAEADQQQEAMNRQLQYVQDFGDEQDLRQFQATGEIPRHLQSRKAADAQQAPSVSEQTEDYRKSLERDLKRAEAEIQQARREITQLMPKFDQFGGAQAPSSDPARLQALQQRVQELEAQRSNIAGELGQAEQAIRSDFTQRQTQQQAEQIFTDAATRLGLDPRAVDAWPGPDPQLDGAIRQMVAQQSPDAGTFLRRYFDQMLRLQRDPRK